MERQSQVKWRSSIQRHHFSFTMNKASTSSYCHNTNSPSSYSHHVSLFNPFALHSPLPPINLQSDIHSPTLNNHYKSWYNTPHNCWYWRGCANNKLASSSYSRWNLAGILIVGAGQWGLRSHGRTVWGEGGWRLWWRWWAASYRKEKKEEIDWKA